MLELFENIDSDKDEELNFEEFQNLLRNKAGLKELQIIEIDELFRFLDRKEKDCILKNNFLNVFGDWKPLKPLVYNKKYFEKLSPRQKNWYEKIYGLSTGYEKSSYSFNKEEDEWYMQLKQKKPSRRERIMAGRIAGRKTNQLGDKKLSGLSLQLKIKEDEVDDVKELTKFADSIDKMLKKGDYKDSTFKENMRPFIKTKSSPMDYKGFLKLAKFTNYYNKNKNRQLEEIFEFITVDKEDTIPLKNLEIFLNKYSYSGGDGTLVAKKHLKTVEDAIQRRMKTRKGKRSDIKSYFYEMSYDKKVMNEKDFWNMMIDLELDAEIKSSEAQQLFVYLDLNGNKCITFNEFAGIFSKLGAIAVSPEDAEKEEKLIVNAVMNSLRKRMKKLNQRADRLFRGLEKNGDVTKREFKEFFEKKKWDYDPQDLALVFERFKMKRSEHLNVDKFYDRLEEDVEEETNEFNKIRICEKIRDDFINYENVKKKDIFSYFSKQSSGGNGYWSRDDFFDYIELNKKKLFPSRNLKPKEEKSLFNYLDQDKDEKISEIEFFRQVMIDDYKQALKFKFGDHKKFLLHMGRKIHDLEYDDIFDYMDTKEMEMNTRIFKKMVSKLGIDTSKKWYQNFANEFDGSYGRKNTKIGFMNDYLLFLEKDKEDDLDVEESLRISKKFDTKDGYKAQLRQSKKWKKKKRDDDYSEEFSDDYEDDKSFKRRKDRKIKSMVDYELEGGRRKLKKSLTENDFDGKRRGKRKLQTPREKFGGDDYDAISEEYSDEDSGYRRNKKRRGYKKKSRSRTSVGSPYSQKSKKTLRFADDTKRGGRKGKRGYSRKITEVDEDDIDTSVYMDKIAERGRKAEERQRKREKEKRREIMKEKELARREGRKVGDWALEEEERYEKDRGRKNRYSDEEKEDRLKKDRYSDEEEDYYDKNSKKGKKKRPEYSDDEKEDRLRKKKRYSDEDEKSKYSDEDEYDKNIRRKKKRKYSDDEKQSSKSRRKKRFDRDSEEEYKKETRAERIKRLRREKYSDSEEDKKETRAERIKRLRREKYSDSEEDSRGSRIKKKRRRTRSDSEEENVRLSREKRGYRRTNQDHYEKSSGKIGRLGKDDEKEDINMEKGFRKRDDEEKRRLKQQIKELKQNHSMVPDRIPKKWLSPQEQSRLNKVLANIINFLIQDHSKFSHIFEKYDYENSGFIAIDDMEHALYHDLRIKPSKHLDLLIDHYLTYNGEISIYNLRADLHKFSTGRISKKKYVIKEEKDINKNLSFYTRETLTAFKPPKAHKNKESNFENTEVIQGIKLFFSKDCRPRMANKQLFDYFDVDEKNRIKRHHFIRQIEKAGFKDFTTLEIENAFDYIDHNHTNDISLNEFRYYFYERDFLEKEVKENAFSSALEEELLQIFKRIDIDESGYMDIDEFVTCLHLLGYIVTPDLIEFEFNEIDENCDNKIDFAEFKILMRKKLRRDFWKLENKINIIKKNMIKIHPSGGEEFNYPQFKAGLEKLDFDLHGPEIKALFYELDHEDQNKIYINDFINLILSNPRDFDNMLAASAILKIKSTYNLGLIELVEAYNKCPSHFCNSFTRANFTALKHLPSHTLYPHLTQSGAYFQDIFGEWKDEKTEIVYPVKPKENGFLRQISIVKAYGVPIPDDKSVNRKQNIVARELRVCIFNKFTGKFVGNTLIYKAEWRPSYEDRWYFEGTDSKHTFICKMDKFAPSKNNGYCIVFELVMFFVHNKIELQMSCGWAAADFNILNTNSETVLKLQGGSPKANTVIKKEDIRAKRTTIYGKLGKMFSNVDCELRIRVRLLNKKNTLLNKLKLLPKQGLFKLDSVNIQRAYRCYLGKNAYMKSSINTNLATNIVTKSFLRCMNLSSLEFSLTTLWNKHVEPKIENFDFEALIEKFEKAMRFIYVMFLDESFKFNPHDQTIEGYSDLGLSHKRKHLINNYMSALESELKGKQVSIRTESTFSNTFDIAELMEDDFNFEFN